MQRSVAASDVGVAASLASHFMDVITTSGDATGVAANLHKIKAMRASCGNAAMAIASGITPANASKYIPYVDCFLVATGISAGVVLVTFTTLTQTSCVLWYKSVALSRPQYHQKSWRKS